MHALDVRLTLLLSLCRFLELFFFCNHYKFVYIRRNALNKKPLFSFSFLSLCLNYFRPKLKLSEQLAHLRISILWMHKTVCINTYMYSIYIYIIYIYISRTAERIWGHAMGLKPYLNLKALHRILICNRNLFVSQLSAISSSTAGIH